MLPVAVAVCVLAAAPTSTPAQAPVKLAATTFNVIDIPATRADFFTDHFADRLTEQGLKVTTPREIASVLGLERQKELLGCSDNSSSCLAEIANALGVDGVVLGDIANLSGRFQVNIKVVASSNGQKIAAFSGSAANEGEVLDVLGAAAKRLAHDVNVAMGRAVAPLEVTQPTEPATPSKPFSKKWAIAPAAVGVVGLGVGVFGFVSAFNAKSDLETKQFDNATDAADTRNTGIAMQTVGLVGAGVGIAALAVAGGVYAMGASEPPAITPSVTVGPSGAAVAISGALPW